MFNRLPTLPIDVKYDLNRSINEINEDIPYDYETFRDVFASTVKLRELTHIQAGENIKKAQEKQRKDYDKRHGKPETTVPIGSKVLLQNLKRQDRKVGRFSYKWIGPYTLESISTKGLCELKNSKGVTLKTKYNVSLIKPFNDGKSSQEFNPLSVSTDQIDEIESQTTPTNQIESQSVPFDQIELQSVPTDQIESQTVPTDQIESQTASTNQLESQTESQTAQTDPLESQTPQIANCRSYRSA